MQGPHRRKYHKISFSARYKCHDMKNLKLSIRAMIYPRVIQDSMKGHKIRKKTGGEILFGFLRLLPWVNDDKTRCSSNFVFMIPCSYFTLFLVFMKSRND